MNTWAQTQTAHKLRGFARTPAALPSIVVCHQVQEHDEATSCPEPPSVLTRACACYRAPIKGHEITEQMSAVLERQGKKVVSSTQAYHLQNISDGHKLFSLPRLAKNS